jgi:hypothetical protein
LTTSEDILLAIREDREVATREDFFMATNTYLLKTQVTPIIQREINLRGVRMTIANVLSEM